MKVEAVIKYLLSSDAGVSALVGTDIFPVVVPKDKSPPKVIVYRVISNVMQPTIDGFSSFRLYKARVQVTAAAPIYSDLKALVQAVRDACHRKSGLLVGVKVVSSVLSAEGSEEFDDAVQMFVQPIDFIVNYHE